MNENPLKKRTIYLTRHGSQAYGLSTPTSDLDLKGVLIGEKRNYLGFLNRVEQLEELASRGGPNDLVIYELQKFFKLASDCNPNIIEVLWTADEDVIFANALGVKLREMAPRFLSQKAKHTFSGYAMAQLKRMKNHYRWNTEPPTEPRPRADLGLPASKAWADHIDKAIVAGKPLLLTPELQAQYEVEKKWREESRDWASFNEWKAGRNPQRAALEAKFGYDTKHGMHLVRLMRMGHEILTTGKVNVRRAADREELLAIRNHGIWSYDQIVQYAEDMDAALTEIYKAGTSQLPKEPDRVALDKECISMIEYYLDNEAILPTWDGEVVR